MIHHRRRAVALIAALAIALIPLTPASAATIQLSGTVFEDADRDGQPDADEAGWGGRGIYVYDGVSGSFVASTATASDGSYVIPDLPAGSYSVRFSSYAWNEVRDSWVPTTTDDVWPVVEVDTASDATVHFGWRPITRSTDLAAPLSAVTGPDGLRVESFTDAVTAAQVDAALRSGSLIGDEAPHTTVRFGYADKSYCGTSVSGAAGNFSNFAARCYVSYRSWLDGYDDTLFHEYGHAWSLYHAHIVQQDETLSAYLEFRGLAGDERLNTSHAWSPREMIAEDYRQLFGSATAAASAQENREIADADDVPGLATFLAETFTTPAGETPTTEPSPEPTPDAAPEVVLESPSDGSTLTGTADVVVVATDDLDVSSGLVVEVAVGGEWVTAPWDGATSTHRLPLDTTTIPDGAVALQARAMDSAGQVASSAVVQVAVDNPEPEPESEAPSGPVTLGPVVVSLTGTATSGKGGSWSVEVLVAVQDGDAAAEGVRVELGWTAPGRHGGAGTWSCTSDADGRCAVTAEFANRTDQVDVLVLAPEPTGDAASTLTLTKR